MSYLGPIALVYPVANLDTVPSLCNSVELLANAGYEVEIYTRFSSKFLPPTFSNPNIQIMPPYPTRWERKGLYRVLPAQYSQPLEIWQRHRKKPYHCVIGVNPRGLIKAYNLFCLTRVPLVYYSLEIMFAEEVANGHYADIKRQEVELSHKASFIIIQDRDRASLLARENDISHKKIVLVPNAPLGPSRRKQGSFWHDKFGLAPELKVVLHTGSIKKWTGLPQIISSVNLWPKNWVLVIHSRFQAEGTQRAKALENIAPAGRVFISRSPVPREQYEVLIDSADIGIAFYLQQEDKIYNQKNIETIGLSSGKISTCLRAGLPVIMNDVKGFPQLIEQEECGVVVQNETGIEVAIEEISENYEEYSSAALRVFNQHLDFANHFQKVIQNIEEF